MKDLSYDYGTRSDGEVHGVVLTKPHIVDLILDLVGYSLDRPLASMRLLEPSCGEGAFVLRAAKRLLLVAKELGLKPKDLKSCIVAVDIEPKHVEQTRAGLKGLCVEMGFSEKEAKELSIAWVHEGDFLLHDFPEKFDAVVGNPPYIRIEQIPVATQTVYRKLYKTLYDRADLYVAFIERSLRLLNSRGVMSFICADRWTLNRYGAPLRAMISNSYRVNWFIDLHQASPFESEVIAYPAIFSISPGSPQPVHYAKMKDGSAIECREIQRFLTEEEPALSGVSYHQYPQWFSSDDPWILSGPEHLAALRDLEERFGPLEADGKTKVGIGVASGNDKVYIVPEALKVESDRLVPLVMRDDIRNGKIVHGGKAILNTFGKDGKVVDLSDYPKLSKYFSENEAQIKKRHVAKKNPNGWFRTIDRVYPDLVQKPKLLIPDIAGSNEVVFDKGNYHPHHNLYFVTSESWDLEVLGGLLSSKVALFFIWSYAVKMRGGYLRFQAQYLRRIRVPSPQNLGTDLQKKIKDAFRTRDFKKLDELAFKAYGINSLPAFDFTDTRN